ncbi:unnamed protein product, partial [Phytomonas sp. EM1]
MCEVRLAVLRAERPRHANALADAFLMDVIDPAHWCEARRTYTQELAEWSAVEYLFDIPRRECGRFFVDPVSGHVATHGLGRFAMQQPPATVEARGEKRPGDPTLRFLCGNPYPTTDPTLFRLTTSLVRPFQLGSPFNAFQAALAQCLAALFVFSRDLTGISAFGLDSLTAFCSCGWSEKTTEREEKRSRREDALPVVDPPPTAEASLREEEGELLRCFHSESLRAKLASREVRFVSEPAAEIDARRDLLRELRRQRRLDEANERRLIELLQYPTPSPSASPGDDALSFSSEENGKTLADDQTSYENDAMSFAKALIETAMNEENLLGTVHAPHRWACWAPHW